MIRACAMLAFALILAAPACPAQALDGDAGTGLAQLMLRLAQRTHGHARFVERQFIRILDRSIDSSGEIFYEAPDRLEKRTSHPQPETLILDRGTLSIQRGKRSLVVSLRDYPAVAPFIDSVRAVLAGDLAALNRTYAPDFTAAGDRWRLVLVPRDAKAAAVVVKVSVLGVGDLIQSMEFERPGGDHSVMTISALSDP